MSGGFHSDVGVRSGGSRGWPEKVAGPGQGELEQGLQSTGVTCSEGDPANAATWVVYRSKGVINAGEIWWDKE